MLIPSAVILSEAKDHGSSLRVNSAKRDKHPCISLKRNAETLRGVYPEPLRLRSGPFASGGRTGSE